MESKFHCIEEIMPQAGFNLLPLLCRSYSLYSIWTARSKSIEKPLHGGQTDANEKVLRECSDLGVLSGVSPGLSVKTVLFAEIDPTTSPYISFCSLQRQFSLVIQRAEENRNFSSVASSFGSGRRFWGLVSVCNRIATGLADTERLRDPVCCVYPN